MRSLIISSFYILFSVLLNAQNLVLKTNQVRKIAFTFDDGDTASYKGFPLEVWNNSILSTLDKYQLKAILFAHGKNKLNEKGRFILQSWNDRGHLIGNHSFAHKNYSHPKATFQWFKDDFLKNDSIIRLYTNYVKLYRFPYLKQGETKEKVDSVQQLFSQLNYKIGHVTVDASDWYINGRLVKYIQSGETEKLEKFKSYYIKHLYNRAFYYDSLSSVFSSKKISHTILLHHNLAAALFLDDLIKYFKAQGWQIIDADEALKDEFYSKVTNLLPSGESLVWSIAREYPHLRKSLRFPAEDGSYEQAAMDSLGL
jgi:peptidoglycan/xylan/chitin deacetylase (PgdA/CDA1 family)